MPHACIQSAFPQDVDAETGELKDPSKWFRDSFGEASFADDAGAKEPLAWVKFQQASTWLSLICISEGEGIYESRRERLCRCGTKCHL